MSEPSTTESPRPSPLDTSASAVNAVAPWSLSMPMGVTHQACDPTATELKSIRLELTKISTLLEQTVTALWEIAAASDGSEDEEPTTSERTYLDGSRR